MTNNNPDRVVKQSEIVRDELVDLDRAMVTMEPKEYGVVIQVPLDDLTTYVMQQRNDEFYSGYRQGLIQGRAEAKPMIDTAVKEVDKARKIIKENREAQK